MDRGHEKGQEHTPPSIIVLIGKTALGIGAAYAGIKLGEDITNYALPFPLEIATATVVGGGGINILR